MSKADEEFAEEKFIGFYKPTSNYFKMPNIWIDVCAHIDNMAELKVVQYILRHTWGFREYGMSKHITIDEFMHGRKKRDGSRMDSGTGLGEMSVRRGLERAEKHGFIVVEIDDRDRARIEKYYMLKMQLEEEGEDDQGYQVETSETEVPDRDLTPPARDPRGTNVRPRTRESKDTSERHFGKDISRGSRQTSFSQKKDSLRPQREHREHWKKVPTFIQSFLQDFSVELGDSEHTNSNITRAHNIFVESNVESEEAFQELMYEARVRARRANVKKRSKTGGANRMPYFFTCLEELAILKERAVV